MSNYSNSRSQRVYLQAESTFGTIPNSSGVPTMAAANAIRFDKFMMKSDVAPLTPPDKTGFRTVARSQPGKRNGKWSGSGSIFPYGTPGHVPELDVIFAAASGQAATISAGVSATYSESDSVASFCGLMYRDPSTVEQFFMSGALVEKLDLEIGAGIANWSASGSAKSVQSSVTFSTGDTDGASGLTAFPTEPAGPITYHGNIVPGFVGTATINGTTTVKLSRAKVSIAPSNSAEAAFGSYYNTIPGGDVRNIELEVEVFDQDDANTLAMTAEAYAMTPITVALQMGVAAGGIVTVTLNGVQFSMPDLDDSGRRWKKKFTAARATGSTGSGSLDECVIAFT